MAVVIVAGLRQQVPGAVIFGSANPDVEVGIDPRTGNQPLQLAEAVRLVPGDGLVDRDGLYFWIGLQSRVEAAQKFAARFWVVLPSVFSVEGPESTLGPLDGGRLRAQAPPCRYPMTAGATLVPAAIAPACRRRSQTATMRSGSPMARALARCTASAPRSACSPASWPAW